MLAIWLSKPLMTQLPSSTRSRRNPTATAHSLCSSSVTTLRSGPPRMVAMPRLRQVRHQRRVRKQQSQKQKQLRPLRLQPNQPVPRTPKGDHGLEARSCMGLRWICCGRCRAIRAVIVGREAGCQHVALHIVILAKSYFFSLMFIMQRKG